MKSDGDTWRIDTDAGSPTRRHDHDRSEGIETHLASDTPPSTAGRPLLWRSQPEIGAPSWEMEGAAPLYTTCCALLKQPDNQKLARS